MNSLTPTAASRRLIPETYFQLSSWHSSHNSLQLIIFTLILLLTFIATLLTLSSEPIW